MLAVDGRVVMVSGASRGIGRAVVDRLLASGFTVSAGMRRPEKVPSNGRFMTHRYAAEESGSAEAWVAATVERFGHVDAVVNAAGLNPKMRVQDEGEDLLDEMWRLNDKRRLRRRRAVLASRYLAGPPAEP